MTAQLKETVIDADALNSQDITPDTGNQLLGLDKHLDKQVRLVMAEGRTEGVLGEHDLLLGEDQLEERSAAGTQTTRFAAIDRVESTETHTFIYLAPAQAHVIPHAFVSEGDVADFTAVLEERCRKEATDVVGARQERD